MLLSSDGGKTWTWSEPIEALPWSKVGDEVPKGFRFGMIRFGSRTEIYLPMSATVAVKIGDRVAGASSVIARLN